MGLKTAVKRVLLGSPGTRPRDIGSGLLRGLRFNVDTASKSMRLLGLDEREIAPAVEDAAASSSAALDVGANDGWYSLYFASRPNIERVWSFEPDANLVPAFEANFALNPPAFKDKVRLVNKFVGDRDDDQFVRIDTLLNDYDKPVVLKIDVDGGELDVLKGARHSLEHKTCRLIVETHAPELERDCIAYLESLNYRTTIVPNGWYRAIVPEHRPTSHNRWFVASRPR